LGFTRINGLPLAQYLDLSATPRHTHLLLTPRDGALAVSEEPAIERTINRR
jgi:hypothetical protein